MIIKGTFIRFLWRNEKTGESKFTVKTSNGNTQICKGIVQNYPKYIPLHLSGELKTEEAISVFYCADVCANGYGYSEMSRFLYGNTFPDIGMLTAKKILAKTGTEVFSFLDKEYQIEEIAEGSGVSVTAIRRCFKILKSYRDFEKLYKYIKEQGGTYNNAVKLYEKYAENSMDVLSNNPYVLLYTDAPYDICEKLAKKYKMEACDKKRIHAIVEKVMQSNQKGGNTKITFHDLCHRIRKLEDSAKCSYHTSALFIGEEILQPQYKIIHAESDIDVYFAEDYEAEYKIAENIKRLSTSAQLLNKEGITINEVEQLCDVSYSQDQRKAFQALDKSGVKIITGGPGTGKTTVLNGILTKYETDNPGKEILLCAPTGCAARRMQETTGRNANTIHKILEIKPYQNINFPVQKKLDADCIIIDECSMVDAYIMAKLLTSIKNGALVLLLGDENQLPSVGAGNVFSDILKSGCIEVYQLNTIFRQGSRSLIIKNSCKVIEGNVSLETDESFRIIRFPDEKNMIDEAVQIAKKCYENKIDFKCYTPSRKIRFKSGSINMNRVLRDVKHTVNKETVHFGFYMFSEEDFIIFNRNNYEKGYFNGQEGIIRNIQKHNGTCYVTIEADGNYIHLSGSELDDIELDYAITAHKSQGGETPNALILIPQNPSTLLIRQLLYVEITRARKAVILLSEKDALEKAISNFMEKERETGLIIMLKKIAQ